MGSRRSDPTKARSIPASWFVVPLAALLLLLVLLGARDLLRNTEEEGARWEIWQQDGPDPVRDRDLIGGADGFAIERSYFLEPNDLILGGGNTGVLEPGRYMLEFAVGDGSQTSVAIAGAEATCLEGSGNGTAPGAGVLVAWRAGPNSCSFVLEVLETVRPDVDHSVTWRHEWSNPAAAGRTFRFSAS